MCGIVGQVRPKGEVVEPELLARMCAALEHRGPDSRGLHHRGRAGIGIQRLRVIDLSTGDQPIFNEDRSVVVVMNGRLPTQPARLVFRDARIGLPTLIYKLVRAIRQFALRPQEVPLD